MNHHDLAGVVVVDIMLDDERRNGGHNGEQATPSPTLTLRLTQP